MKVVTRLPKFEDSTELSEEYRENDQNRRTHLAKDGESTTAVRIIQKIAATGSAQAEAVSTRNSGVAPCHYQNDDSSDDQVMKTQVFG